MATRISFQFVTFYNETFRVDIDDASWSDPSIDVDVSDDGFTLRHDGSIDTVIPGIMGSSCEVSLLITPDNSADIQSFADDLLGSAETRFTLAVYKITAGPTTSLYWCGYLLRDLGSFQDIGTSYFFTVKASDGLARLKTVDYSDTSGSPTVPYGSLSFLEHIVTCLTEIGTDSYWGGSDTWLRTIVNWTSTGMPTLAADKDPLDYSRVTGEVFAKPKVNSADADYDYLSMYKVLEQLCIHWCARLLLSNGAWRFEQVRERMEENFYERRYDTTGTLLSSAASAGYDKSVVQANNDNRLSGGEFAYLPALKSVEVLYKHNTYLNKLSGQTYRWQKNTTYSSLTYSQSNIAYDSDTFFKVSGVFNLDASVSYTAPWRYVVSIRINLPTDGYKLKSTTTGVSSGPGVYKYTRTTPVWTTDSGAYYEVSTDFITSGNFKGKVPFAFYTPYIPADQKGFEINFFGTGGGRLIDESPVGVTLNDWSFSNLVMTINGLDDATNFEAERLYKANNATDGNSDEIKIDELFGHPVFSWTPTKIEVTSDQITWTDSTGSWDRGTETDDREFGDLIASQMMRMQQLPVQTYSGTLLGDAIHAHSRITFADNTTYLINRSVWRAKKNLFDVEMLLTGVADGADIDVDTPVSYPGPGEEPGGDGYHLVAAPNGSDVMTAEGDPGKTALAILTGNYVDTHISAGTVTSIDVAEPISGTYHDGDLIFVVNPQTQQIYTFVIDGDQAAGSTTLDVVSTTTDEDIPVGAQVIYSPFNLFTQSTGGGTPFGGSGDINDGGNTTGATIVIGTNDANNLEFETNNVSRLSIAGGASTGGAVTVTDVTPNTSTPENVLTLVANSSGTAAAGFGPAVLLQGESSTTNGQDIAKIASVWTTATHGSRTSDIVFYLVVSAGSLAEHLRIVGAATPALKIGGGSTSYTNSGITSGANYTVGGSPNSLTLGSSTGTVTISSSANSTQAININSSVGNGTSGNGVTIQTTGFTNTSGDRYALNLANHSITAGSGSANYGAMRIMHSVNQTGTASGSIYGVKISPTLTAILGTYYALYSDVNSTSAKGVYQSGASTTNNIEGATAFGTTSAPDASAIVDIVSTSKGFGLPAMTTAQVNAISSPRDGLAVYDTDTDTVKVRANGSWISLGTGSGTVTGTATAGQVAYWDGSGSIAGDTALVWDSSNNRLGINQPSPGVSLGIITAGSSDGIRVSSDGTLDQDVWGIELVGTATGPYVQRARISLDVYSNSGASPDGESMIFTLSRDGGSTYQPFILYRNQAIFNNASGFNIANNTGRLRFQASSAGIFNTDNNWLLGNSSYTTNDSATRLKLGGIGTTSSYYGLKVADSGNTTYLYVRDDQRLGLGVDPADAKTQIKGDGTTTAKALLVENSSGTDNFYVQDSGLVSGVAFQTVSSAPSEAYGAGAGTGPSTDLLAGGQNGFNFFFTTGTGPSASSTVATITLPKSFANGCAASWLPANAATQAIIGNFWLSGTSNNSITIAYTGTLAASTAYALSITIIGY